MRPIISLLQLILTRLTKFIVRRRRNKLAKNLKILLSLIHKYPLCILRGEQVFFLDDPTKIAEGDTVFSSKIFLDYRFDYNDGLKVHTKLD